MLDVRNCPRCGRVFAFRSKDVCPQCEREEEEMFERVRLFLRRRPGATLEEVEEATEVPSDIVLSFLRQGRLLATGGLTGLLSCERCGAPIEKGFLCEKCSLKLSRQIADQVSETPPRSGTGAVPPGAATGSAGEPDPGQPKPPT
ncbi:MAG TPA: hypothetical protein GX513_13240, partial [Firmicutes bacterium]|nr:hypothetical protein [Bacillota bacterium]